MDKAERPWREQVGPPELFDVIGAQQFCVLVKNGLREHHKVLDFGCGCLRLGRFLLTYLEPFHYFGIEPNAGLVNHGLYDEAGAEVVSQAWPTIHYWADFKFADRLGVRTDYVMAHSIITHAGLDLTQQIFEEAFGVLEINGVFVGTFFVGASDSEDVGWLGNKVAAYRPSTIARVADQVGFTTCDLKDYGHPMKQTWFIARK